MDGVIKRERLKSTMIILLASSHAIFADSLFSQVLYARDRWLAKGGYIIPNVANLYIQGIVMDHHPMQMVQDSTQPMLVLDDHVSRQSVMTDSCLVKSLNLSTAREDDEFFRSDFKLRVQCDSRITGCLLHFDISSTNAKAKLQKLFSNGPEAPKTYIKQTLLFLEDHSLKVGEQELISGRFSLALSNFAPRGVEFSLAMWRAK